MKSLIVDDKLMIREGIKNLFHHFKVIHELHEVTDGLEAIKISSNIDFDIILMDISMPNLDGLNATEKNHEKKL
jgi:YesN/AraC family two-component response regulator